MELKLSPASTFWRYRILKHYNFFDTNVTTETSIKWNALCMLGANSAGIGERRKKGKVKEEKGKRKGNDNYCFGKTEKHGVLKQNRSLCRRRCRRKYRIPCIHKCSSHTRNEVNTGYKMRLHRINYKHDWAYLHAYNYVIFLVLGGTWEWMYEQDFAFSNILVAEVVIALPMVVAAVAAVMPVAAKVAMGLQ